MFPFQLRSIFETLQVLASIAERQQRQVAFADDGFQLFPSEDHDGVGLPVIKPKMYSSPRNLDLLTYIVSHVTAVKGGFGVNKRRVRLWAQVLHDPKKLMDPWIFFLLVKAELLHEDGQVNLENGSPGMLAKRLALWDRYRSGVPYHQIGAANGDNLANRPLIHRTWHGSLGNFGAGWSLDVSASQHLEDWHVETGRASLVTLCGRILKVSPKARKEGVLIAPHRAFSPSRRKDNGANTHREIIIPTAAKLDCLEIDYHMQKGKGRPIPRGWDPNALYDYRGRHIGMEHAA